MGGAERGIMGVGRRRGGRRRRRGGRRRGGGMRGW